VQMYPFWVNDVDANAIAFGGMWVPVPQLALRRDATNTAFETLAGKPRYPMALKYKGVQAARPPLPRI
jgi:hypothetical protein